MEHYWFVSVTITGPCSAIVTWPDSETRMAFTSKEKAEKYIVFKGLKNAKVLKSQYTSRFAGY